MKNWRINLIFFFIVLMSAVIISRLIYLQVVNGELYGALAQGQQKLFFNVEGKRGDVFLQDKENNLYEFATDRSYLCVDAYPREVEDKEETARILAEVLEEEEDIIFEKLKKNVLWQPIKNKLTKKEAESLAKLSLPGIVLSENVFRDYPHGAQASHVIGFVGGEGLGQYGVEGYYDKALRREEELREKEKGAFGYLSSSQEGAQSSNSKFILTLDYNIQFMAEKLLKEAEEKWKMESGTIMVLDPNTGAVLALANYPAFDLNSYSKVDDPGIFKNPVIQEIFEPGSVFKPITMAAALNEGKITPETTYVDKGFLKIGGFTIYNYNQKTWGKKTMTEVLEHSINTGAVFVERQLGHSKFLEYIQDFGFFERTNIDLQGETFFDNPELKKGYEINFATASFGQGIAITPMQLACFFCAVANGGELVKPYVLERVIEESGKAVETKIEKRRIIEQKTSSLLAAMMASVVENGIAKRAQIPGYFIAGKTGTAQIPCADRRGYLPDQTIQTFVGFAPAFDPEFLIMIKLDKPQGAREASASAVPIFKELAEYVIDYLEVPPDYVQDPGY